MSERRSTFGRDTLIVVLLLLALGLAIAFALDRKAISEAETRATTAQAEADRLLLVRDSLERLVRATDQRRTAQRDSLAVLVARWQRIAQLARGRVDTLPGSVDTVPVPVEVIVAVADSTIQACQRVVATCEEQLALEQQRTTVERTRGDSLQSAATNWKRVARGPFLSLALEGTVTQDWAWQAAGDVTFGRGNVKALVRGEVGEGQETCSFAPNVEAYTCSTPIEGRVRVGARWTP